MARSGAAVTPASPSPTWRGGIGLLLLAVPVSAGERVTETELVKLALEGPTLHAQLDAVRARGDAAGTVARPSPNPTLDLRREQGGGPDGPSLDAVGGSVTVDLGLSGLAEVRAAGLRGEAGEAWLRAEGVAAVCAVREGALAHWSATERATVSGVAHARLDELLGAIDALATAGERAAYDRDRVALTVTAHRQQVDGDVVEAARAEAALDALTGVAVGEVALLPLPALGPLQATVEGALSSDPVLLALRTEQRAAEVALVAARRGALPDLTVSGAARWESPEPGETSQGYEVGAALELPLVDRGQAARAEARASLAELEAYAAQREAGLRARVSAAWRVASDLGTVRTPSETDPLWKGARQRYAAGEAGLEELLAVATDIEAAEVAVVEGEALRRSSRLQLACLTGIFDHPELQALVEEQTR